MSLSPGGRVAEPSPQAAAPDRAVLPAGSANRLRPLYTKAEELTVIGQLHGLYVLCSSPQGLILVDQHAAHERLTYERLKAGLAQGEMPRQGLLTPQTLELTPGEAAWAGEQAGQWARLGLELEPFGGNTWAIRAVAAPPGRGRPPPGGARSPEPDERQRPAGGDPGVRGDRPALPGLPRLGAPGPEAQARRVGGAGGPHLRPAPSPDLPPRPPGDAAALAPRAGPLLQARLGARLMPAPALVVLAGPTAVGKTGLSLNLARRFNAEIVGADSVQIYRGLDIGSAKPTPAEQAQARHHLIDVAEPTETFSAARYARLATEAIDDIQARGKRALVVGGTGLYIKALIFGLAPTPPVDEALRARLRDEWEAQGPQAMHQRLAELDPDTAAKLHPNDRQRVLRALEVCLQIGRAHEPPPAGPRLCHAALPPFDDRLGAAPPGAEPAHTTAGPGHVGRRAHPRGGESLGRRGAPGGSGPGQPGLPPGNSLFAQRNEAR